MGAYLGVLLQLGRNYCTVRWIPFTQYITLFRISLSLSLSICDCSLIVYSLSWMCLSELLFSHRARFSLNTRSKRRVSIMVVGIKHKLFCILNQSSFFPNTRDYIFTLILSSMSSLKVFLNALIPIAICVWTSFPYAIAVWSSPKRKMDSRVTGAFIVI